MWDDGARGGPACQRARLDPGIGPVRNRFEGSNPRPAKGVGTNTASSTGWTSKEEPWSGPRMAARIEDRGKRFPPELAEESLRSHAAGGLMTQRLCVYVLPSD